MAVEALPYPLRVRQKIDARHQDPSYHQIRRRTFFHQTDPQTELYLAQPHLAGVLRSIAWGPNGEVILDQWPDTQQVKGELQKPSRAKPKYDYEDHTPKGKPATQLRPKVFHQGMETAQRGIAHTLDEQRSEVSLVLRMEGAYQDMEAFVKDLESKGPDDLVAFANQRQQIADSCNLLGVTNHDKERMRDILLGNWGPKNVLVYSSKLGAFYEPFSRRREAVFEGIKKYAALNEVFPYVRIRDRQIMEWYHDYLVDILDRSPVASNQALGEARVIWQLLKLAALDLDLKLKFAPYATRVWKEIENWGTVNVPEADTAVFEPGTVRYDQLQKRYERQIPTATNFLSEGDLESAKRIIAGSVEMFGRVLDLHGDVNKVRPSSKVDQRPSDKSVPDWVINIIQAKGREALVEYRPLQTFKDGKRLEKAPGPNINWLRGQGLEAVAFSH